jgi:hypothetical protein
MIGDIAVEPEPAEPPVRQIKVDLLAKPPLISGRKTSTRANRPFGIDCEAARSDTTEIGWPRVF